MSRRRLPSLEALRIFEAAARLGGFTAAAAEVGLSQSAVSLRMRDLQADLGVALFAQTRPRTSLTPAGERLARDVRAGLQVIAAALDEVAADRAQLRISVNPTFARWLAPRLSAFTDRADCAIDLDVGIDRKPVGPGGVEVALRSGRGDWPGLEAVPILPLERTPMLTPALLAELGPSPSPATLARLPLLYSEHWRDWFEAAGGEPPDYAVRSERYPTQDLLAEAALNGSGVALLSPTVFRPQIQRGLLVAPFAPVLTGPDAYYAVYQRGAVSDLGRAFIEWLAREAAHDREARQ